MPRGNPSTLVPFVKGEDRRGAGRAPGTLNRTTRLLKMALITAAEKSRHSDGSLEAYCQFLADDHPTTFAMMLARLLPIQARVQAEGNVRVDLEKLALNMSMPLSEMISRFEQKIKDPTYFAVPRSRVIEHSDDDDADD